MTTEQRIKSRAEQEVEQRTGRDDIPAYLRELYVGRRWSDDEIARTFGVSRVTVWNWRTAWGIRTEQRYET